MNDLLDVILMPLPSETAALVRQRFEETGAQGQQSAQTQEQELYALGEALQDVRGDFPAGWWLDSTHSRFWLCLHVDWKASDEAEWQVQAIARSLGIVDTFVSALRNQSRVQTQEVLIEAAAWLRAHGYELLNLNTGGDEYLAVPIRIDLLRAAFLAADRLVHLDIAVLSRGRQSHR